MVSRSSPQRLSSSSRSSSTAPRTSASNFAGLFESFTDTIALGVLAGLIVGKIVGIAGSTFLLPRPPGIRIDPSIRWIGYFEWTAEKTPKTRTSCTAMGCSRRPASPGRWDCRTERSRAASSSSPASWDAWLTPEKLIGDRKTETLAMLEHTSSDVASTIRDHTTRLARLQEVRERKTFTPEETLELIRRHDLAADSPSRQTRVESPLPTPKLLGVGIMV